MGHGVARTREPHRLAIDTDDAGVESVGAEDCARGLRPSGADQPGEPQDLAVMDGERDVDELDRVRIRAVRRRVRPSTSSATGPGFGIGRSP